jgi:hypothetical protein
MNFRPNKPRDPHSAKYYVTRLIDQAGGTEVVATLLGRAPTRVRAYADEQAKEQISYEKVRALTLAAGARACAEDLAFLAGGMFVPDGAGKETLTAYLSRSEKEHGDFRALLCASVEKHGLNSLSEKERGALLAELDDEIRALVGARIKLQGRDEG